MNIKVQTYFYLCVKERKKQRDRDKDWMSEKGSEGEKRELFVIVEVRKTRMLSEKYINRVKLYV